MKQRQLIVGRDRAHVRALLLRSPQSEAISASAFFDRVRMLAFLADEKLVRDDHAPLIFAHDLVALGCDFPPSYSRHFAQAFSALYHGTTPPSQVHQKTRAEKLACGAAIEITSHIQELMTQHNLVNKVSALYKAWRILKEQKAIPPGLVNYSSIALTYLIDLTALEVEVIKSLSRLGLHFDICFPLDFAKRKLNVAVDFAARQFENSSELCNIDLSFDKLSSDGPLVELVDSLLVDEPIKIKLNQQHCTLYEANMLDEEANRIAALIASKKSQSSCSIALVMRSYDQRAELFKRALVAHNISVKDRKGQPLLESPAGILLEIVLSARLNSLSRTDLISLINHPLFCEQISNDSERSAIINLLTKLGIDDSFIALGSPLARYELAITRFKKALSVEEQNILGLEKLERLLFQLKNILEILPVQASFKNFLLSLEQIIESFFCLENSSVQVLLENIIELGNSFAHQSSKRLLALHDAIALLKAPLASITVARPDHSDPEAVEFLLLPELLGRSFDHVFIADISFGHMPKNPNIDPIFNDEQRRLLNKTLGCQALRVFLDDPFEPLPVPPRQALEPFWFAAAIASAQSSVHFSYARHNQNGVEQAPSEFFTWLKEHIQIISESSLDLKFISPEYARFLAGKQEAKLSLSPQALALKQRKRAFKNQETDIYSFGFNQSQMLERFLGRLGQKPWRALTPTMVEAFARCRFQGLVSRILQIEPHREPSDDIDARVLGQIAHQSLELFFATVRDRSSHFVLKNILTQVVLEYERQNYLANPDIFYCYIDWLYEALAKLVHNFSIHRPLAQEQAFGLKPSDPKALKIKILDQSYLLGGVIDRVDRIADQILLTDYKLSSSDTLRSTGSPKALCKSNFQVPIYLRLAAKTWANNDPTRISFAFASIRDGEIMPALSQAQYPELFARIFDDEHEEGLASALHQIFKPISEGQATASKGEHCSTCHYAQVCRVSEASRP